MLEKRERQVGIVMGSDSDLVVMKEAAQVLEDLGIGYSMRILSAHRTPEAVKEFLVKGEEEGIEVYIAGAGKAAHLPGVIASYTLSPVIGVPIGGSSLAGMDALYSIVQMPSGFPVATVAINGSKNAGILAAQTLALGDEALRRRLKDLRLSIKEGVLEKDKALREKGYQEYLSKMEERG